MNEAVNALVSNIEKVIIGKRDIILKIIAALLCDGHVLIEDVPGVGKTQLVGALAKSINGKFNRIQLTPDIMPSDITGFMMIDPTTNKFVYRNGAAVCNFLLADEINRSSPKVQSALLEIMEEHQISIDSKTLRLPKPFMVLATQNSIESYGTYNLPEAQMDRFLIKISMGYLRQEEEIRLLDHVNLKTNNVEPILSTDYVIALRDEIKKIKVSDSIKDYIVRLANNSRNNENIKLGISPRGSIGLNNMSKAIAFMNNRNYVVPDDVLFSAPMVLAHRIILSPQGKSFFKTQDKAVEHILKNTPLPEISFNR